MFCAARNNLVIYFMVVFETANSKHFYDNLLEDHPKRQ